MKKNVYQLIFLLWIVFGVFSCKSMPQVMKDMGVTIVIDAGHGGIDSGAVGMGGLKEKDISLDIAIKTKEILHYMLPSSRIILTRTKDEYVALEKRIKIANNNKAHIFISLHGNSSHIKTAKGFEVYSLDVASDKHAEKLSKRENDSFKEKKKGVKFILAHLRASSNRKESDALAEFLRAGIVEQTSKIADSKNINDRGVQQALFNVLFVNMPAVLIELFFLSNPYEEKLLKNPNFRRECARGIALGIVNYFSAMKKEGAFAHAK